MSDLFDVAAVSLETGAHRMIAAGKSEADADAIIAIAVMRRGVEEEFFMAIPHGSREAVEPTP